MRVFITIEDESAVAKIIVWPKVFDGCGQLCWARATFSWRPCSRNPASSNVVADTLKISRPGGQLADPRRRDRQSGTADEGAATSKRIPAKLGQWQPAKPLARLLKEMPELAGDLDVTARGSAHARHVAVPPAKGNYIGGATPRPTLMRAVINEPSA